MDILKAISRANLPRNTIRLILAFAALALAINILACWKAYRTAPLREGASRSLMAASSSYFYGSGLAEPVPVAALKLAMATGADPDKALRLEGLALFAMIAVLTFFVLKARFGEMAAALAALFLSSNPYMGYYAMQGSSHLYALFFLLLFWHYFDASPAGDGLQFTERRRRAEALLAGLFGGLACLSRLDAVWALLCLAVLSLAMKRSAFDIKGAGLALGAAFLLTLPYTLYQKAHYANFFYAQELSLRRWANIDKFGYRPQTPPPAGPLGAGAFLLRDGPAAAFGGVFKGLGRSFGYELPRVLYYKFLLVLVFLGFYSALVSKKERLLFFFAASLLPLLPLAGINQVPSSGGIELRYYLWALWALCALAGLGFQEILAWTETSIDQWAAKKAADIKRASGK